MAKKQGEPNHSGSAKLLLCGCENIEKTDSNEERIKSLQAKYNWDDCGDSIKIIYDQPKPEPVTE